MHPPNPSRRPWSTVLVLLVTALLVALAAVVVVAPPAGADSLGGAEPTNYQTRVLGVRPSLEGVSVEVVDAGTRLRLDNRSRREVVVLGYQSEPWLRVGPGQSVTWHDHRAHWEADEPPDQVRRSPSSAHVAVPEWTVELSTGRRLAVVVGEVRWVPGPSPLPWLAGAALLAMAVVAGSRGRRWLGALVAAVALVVALDLVQLTGASLGARPPLAAKLLSLGASAAGWVLAGLAVRQLLRRRLESGLFQLLLAAGLLTVVSGLGDLGFLLRSQLASGLPDWMVRAAVTAKLGLGAGAVTAAALHLRALLAAQGLATRGPGTTAVGAGAVDNAAHPLSGPATLPHRGARVPGPGVEAVQPWGTQLWDWDDEDPEDSDDAALPGERFAAAARVPELHVVGGRASRRPRPATWRPEGAAPTSSSTSTSTSASATVVPWPSSRRPGTVDDPDLPGGA
jgi:hypothetical protein